MALANATSWNIWTTGATTSGGGFNPANANFPTDGVLTGGTGNTPTLASASYNFVAGDVGAWVFFPASGTAYAGWYIITAVNSNIATLNAAAGAAQVLGAAGQTGAWGAVGAVTGRQVGIASSWISNRPIGFNETAGCNSNATATTVTWGIDYSQQASAAFAFTDLASTIGTTNPSTFTSSLKPVGVNMVGNIVNVTSGTNWTVQRFEVVSVSGTTGTADKALGSAASISSGVGNLGGAVVKPTDISAILLAGNYLAMKATASYGVGASTWTITAAVKGDTTNGRITMEGYTTIRGARDGKPTITTATNSVNLITLNDNDFWEFIHLKMTHTAGTRGAAFTSVTSLSSPVWYKDLTIGTSSSDSVLSFMSAALNGQLSYMEGVEVAAATSSTSALVVTTGGGVATTWYLLGCYIHESTGGVVKPGNANCTFYARESTFAHNTNAAIDMSGLTTGIATITLHACTCADNGSDVIKLGNSSGTHILELENNIAYGNTGTWVNNAQALMVTDGSIRINRNNFLGSNGGNYTLLTPGSADVALSANPFVNNSGANRNYALNATAGGGASIRAAAFPASWGSVPDVLNYRDGGAAQHQDAGSAPNYGVRTGARM